MAVLRMGQPDAVGIHSVEHHRLSGAREEALHHHTHTRSVHDLRVYDVPGCVEDSVRTAAWRELCGWSSCPRDCSCVVWNVAEEI